jgi:radical SAM superfamily enzyme YgiQ (UPF0313 family)
MHVKFVYPGWDRPSECHPELADVNASPYIGTPSLAAAALAAVTPAEHTVSFHDDRVTPVQPARDADVVAMPVFTPAADRAMELADRYRELGVPVVAGGIFTSLMPQAMAPHVDSVCVGEGEGVWPQMLADLAAGELRPRYDATNAVDLGEVPLPRYDLYVDWVDEMRNQRRLDYPDLDFPVQISRGCPRTCDHCVVPYYLGPKIRFVPPARIRAIFERLQELGDWRGATLIEDVTMLPARRIQDHLEQVVEACGDLDTTISYFGSSPEFVAAARDEFFRSLQKLGVLQLYVMFGFGPLSRAATAHDAAPAASQKVVDTIHRIQDFGMEVYGSFSVGHEQEDESVFDRTLDICRRGGVRVAEFAVATPYPGSPAWRRVVAEDRLLGRPWREFNDANVVFRPNRMSADRLQRIYLDLWQEFYRERPRSRWPVQL